MTRTRTSHRQAGSALFTAVIVTILLGTLALLFMTLSTRHQQEGSAANRRMNAFYAAEAGLNVAWVELQNGGDGSVGSEAEPDHLGGLEFFVQATDLGDGLVALVATGSDGHARSRVELVAEDQSGAVTDFGIFAEEYLECSSNSLVDSYDSQAGTYASQVSGNHARTSGNIGSNGDIKLDSNAKVHGLAQYGPDSDDGISLGSNTTLSGGHGAAEEHIALAPIVAPAYTSLGALSVNTGQVKTIGPGNLQYTTLTAKSNAKVTVVGPCNLVLSSGCTLNANSELIFDARSGPIQVYALNNFELNSNSKVSTASSDPTRLAIFLAGQHTSKGDTSPKVTLNSNSQFYGTLYAPDLSLSVSSNFNLYGSLKAEWLKLESNAKVHYDERLGSGATSGTGYVVRAWRQLEGEQTATMPE